MTKSEYEKLAEQAEMLQEVQKIYCGCTIENIIKQIDSRLEFAKAKK